MRSADRRASRRVGRNPRRSVSLLLQCEVQSGVRRGAVEEDGARRSDGVAARGVEQLGGEWGEGARRGALFSCGRFGRFGRVWGSIFADSAGTILLRSLLL